LPPSGAARSRAAHRRGGADLRGGSRSPRCSRRDDRLPPEPSARAPPVCAERREPMTSGNDLLELEVPEHRPGFFDDLGDELRPRPARVTRPRLLVLAAAAAVVAGALAFGLTRGSDVASAAQVRAAVERALASTGSISGVSVRYGARSRFIVSSTGAFRG